MKEMPDTIDYILGISATAFRLGREGQANETLIRLIDALTVMLPQVPAEKLAEFGILLPEILAAQTSQDYLRIADLLEYRLAPLLGLSTSTPSEIVPFG